VAGTHFLRNVSLFADLSNAELEPLAERLVTRRFRAGEQILTQGSPGNSLYIVKSGLVAIIVTNTDGSIHTVAEMGPGQVFGEFALLDGLPRSAGAVARERSEVLILGRSDFFLVLEKHPTIAIALLVLISRRLRFTMQRTEDELPPTSPETALAQMLCRLADRYGRLEDGLIRLPLRLTVGEIAGMLGQPRSLTEKALDSLREDGLLDLRGLQLTILDLTRLRARCTHADHP